MTTISRYGGDLGRIAEIHREAFPGFFLARLGIPFLKVYYNWVREFPQGILITAGEGEGLHGFVAGFIDSPEFYRYCRSRRHEAILPVAQGVVRSPGLIGRALYNVARVKRNASVTSVSAADESELASIAVRPGAASRGLGASLVTAFCEASRQAGATGVVLTTDRDDNEAVNRFYLKNGFVVRREFMSGSRRAMFEYWRPLVP